MANDAFRKSRPSVELWNNNYLPRKEVQRAIREQLSFMRGDRYKFKLVLCREPDSGTKGTQ